MAFIYGSSSYTIVDGPSWTQAEANAISLGGHLCAITSCDESEFIINTFKNNPNLKTSGGIHTPHIGILDDENGAWRWSSNEEVIWTNWAPSNPHENGPLMKERW